MDLDKFLANKGKRRLLVISGAGLSAESGISTFRFDEDALWENTNVNHVCNIANLSAYYHKVHAFYNTLRVNLKEKVPNAAHHVIAELEKQYGDDLFLHMTTNVDDLYERAGGTAMHLHGDLLEVIENYSLADNSFNIEYLGYEAYIPKEGVYAKPNVVMFGESERYVYGERVPLYEDRNKVLASLTDQDTVVVVGSSDTVIQWSSMAGASPAYTYNVNIRKSDNDWMFSEKIYKPASEAIPKLKDIILLRMDL
jgi:NAD-dependent protein deacetylases, SIR2 family